MFLPALPSKDLRLSLILEFANGSKLRKLQKLFSPFHVVLLVALKSPLYLTETWAGFRGVDPETKSMSWSIESGVKKRKRKPEIASMIQSSHLFFFFYWMQTFLGVVILTQE